MNRKHPAFGNLPLEELAKLPTFYIPTLSHDKSKIAFYWDKTGEMELYLLDPAAGAAPVQVSKGQLPRDVRAGFAWARDGKAVFFAKDKDGDEQHNVWRLDLETGEAEQLTENPKAQEYPVEVSPDDKTLLVLSNLRGQLNLYALDLQTHEYTPLTDYANPVGWGGGAGWSPDGSQIYYGTNETDNLKNLDLYIMDADGSNKRRIIQMKVGSQDGAVDWSKDGRYLSIGSDFDGYDRAGVYDLETGEIRWFTPEGQDYFPGPFSPDGTKVLAAKNADSAIETTVYDVGGGEPVPVELPPGLSYNADWIDNDRFLVNITTDVTRPELRDYRLGDGQSSVLLAAEYGSIDPALFTTHEYVWYESFDELVIPAILYRPHSMEPGKKYPALVEVHGGPTGQWFRGFDPFAQFLADNGYIVIKPNVRGSTGYGVEFRDMALKDWGGGDLEDVAAAADYLRTLPEVDPERVGVWGGSYGGYMTFIAMTKKPTHWKAGTAWVGISDLLAMYGESMEHFKYFLREQMGDPEENVELWKDRSAVNFLHQMTGKLLIVHGVTDPRCPISQARIARDKLLELGKVEGEDFEYIELEDVGHGSQGIDEKIRMYQILIDFLDRSL
ncbi:MAG: S9 family peptidase [Anaerolineae bacterium]|nr:S9 family peptidase [Anaerolineae bacterium]